MLLETKRKVCEGNLVSRAQVRTSDGSARAARIFANRALDCGRHHFAHRCSLHSKFLEGQNIRVIKFVIPGAPVGVAAGSCAGVATGAGVSGPVGNLLSRSGGVFASSALGVALDKPLRLRGMRLSEIVLEHSSTDGSSLGTLRALLMCRLGP